MENQQTNNNDNLVGILAYITLIGWIVALVMNNDKQGETKSFGAFHLRQALGLMIVAIVTSIVLAIVSTMLALILGPLAIVLTFLLPLVSLGFLALAVLGIINAANNKMIPLPIIGNVIESKLNKTFE